MVTTPVKTEKRLTIQTVELAADTTAIRCLDWDRDRFDVEFSLDNGTTYNSYLIRSDKTALVDTAHVKCRKIYLETLTSLIDPKKLDYIIVNHTEPDHSGLIKDVLEIAPQAVVVASKVAIKFLEDLIHKPFERREVKTGDLLDLGNGHVIEFVSAPNLHWPDTIFTYDRLTQAIFTCDVFGMHYCSDTPFDEDLEPLEAEYRFYYECLMAPNLRSLISALEKMDNLGGVKMVGNSHGPILYRNTDEMIGRYRTWSQNKVKAEKTVAIFYTSDYGYGDRISQAIAKGISKTEAAVEMLDLKSADPQEVHLLVARSGGIVIGMPPLSSSAQKDIANNLGTILAVAKPGQAFGLYEPYGGNDEPIDPLSNRLRDLGLKEAFPVIKVKQEPNEALYKQCEEAGTDLGQVLTLKSSIEHLKAISGDLEKAMGRLNGGLYIITAQKGELTGAMVASWVAQASFEPLGVSVALAKDRAIESLMQVGNRFVLNVLEEGNYQQLMKHFLKRFKPGDDRFAGVSTQTADNGSPILTDALAYLECQVVSRMECTDHWIVYSHVDRGRVSKPEGFTAIHHRKVGNYY